MRAKLMLHGTIRNHNNVAARNNVVILCCAKNRRCEHHLYGNKISLVDQAHARLRILLLVHISLSRLYARLSFQYTSTEM